MDSKIDNLLRLQIRLETKLPLLKLRDRRPEVAARVAGRRHHPDQFSESFYAIPLGKTAGKKHFGMIHHSENEENIHRERKHRLPLVQEIKDSTNIRGWIYNASHTDTLPLSSQCANTEK